MTTGTHQKFRSTGQSEQVSTQLLGLIDSVEQPLLLIDEQQHRVLRGDRIEKR